MKKFVVTTLFITLILSLSANAFDGNRKGFVIGCGLGLGPVAKTDGVNNPGFALNFLFGYAWDEQNMIVYLEDVIAYTEKSYDGKNLLVLQGFQGIGYFHYFGPQGKSFFINGGLGIQGWTAIDLDDESSSFWSSNNESDEIGLGFLIGGGYEFAGHVQFYSSFSFGKSSDDYYNYNHRQLQISISVVAF